MKPKTIVIKDRIDEAKISKKEGHFFDETHFDTIIKEDCDVYVLDENKEKKLLLSFRKKVIKPELCCKAYNALAKEAQKKHNNRGSAAGLLNTKKLPKYVKQTTAKSKFRSYYIGSDGKAKKDHISNYVKSGIIGYFDRYDRNVFNKSNGKKTKKNSIPTIPCRTTKFTENKYLNGKTHFLLLKRQIHFLKN